MVRLAELFSYDRYTVLIYGQEKYFEKQNEKKNSHIHLCKTLQECIQKTNIVIGGIPLTKDNITINTTYSDKEISLKEVQSLVENKTFIAGKIPSCFYEDEKIKNIDLLQSEALTILNAIPTVEGAIKIAIEETEYTLHESNVLIYGFGRIGKILCDRFKSMGANVYCVARKEADLAWIREKRCIPITYDKLENYAQVMDLMINTVPVVVIQEEMMKKMKRDCFIIDLASNPGGVDKMVANKYNIKVITALGVPGRIAPLSAAKYIKTIIETNLVK